jgi:thioredoxin 1
MFACYLKPILKRGKHMSDKILHVTDSNFDTDVLKSDKPVLLDFWAPWCGPCKAIGPVLEELANSQDAVTIAKMNVDESAETPNKFAVRSIPTLIMFKDGEAVATKVGAAGKAQLIAFIEEHS